MLWVSAIFILLSIVSIKGDKACLALSGRCQIDTIDCLGGYRSGLCNGAANRRCCLPAAGDAGCTALGGFCQANSIACKGGYRSGLCADGSSRQCCLPFADRLCNGIGGTCQLTTEECDGKYLSCRCGGDCDRKCCLPATTSGVECLKAADITAIQEKLIEYEGIRFTAYDAQPKNAYVDWTICVGFNLKRADARAIFKKVLPGVDFDSVYAGTKALTRAQCLALLKHDLTETYIPRAAKIVGKQWCKLPLNVKIALVNAVYRGDLAYGHKTAKLMRAGNWCAVKAEYLKHDQYINCVKLGIPGICTRMDWNAKQFHTMCK